MISPGRLGRTESKRRTRDRLLESAATVFRQRGYRSASVEEVAANAGYTIGALYSNFSGKDEVLLALLEQEIRAVVERVGSAAGRGEGVIDSLGRGAQEWIAFLDEEPELYALLIEFWTIWVRDPEQRPRHAERFRAVREAIGGLVAEQADELGVELALPAEQVGAAIVALADGLALQRLADRDAIPDDLLASVLGVLVPALASQSQGAIGSPLTPDAKTVGPGS